jgi:hypothetical protein
MRLENKIAVVTGGAHGIEKAVAEIPEKARRYLLPT